MKKVFFEIIVGVLIMLIETSLWAGPWLLIYFFHLMGKVKMERLFVMGLILGIIADALAVRYLGQSSLLLIILIAGIWVLRRTFSGITWAEIFWVFLLAIVWQVLFLEKVSLVIIGVSGLILVLLRARGRLNLMSEIRLK